jgi:hypothetical protein
MARGRIALIAGHNSDGNWFSPLLGNEQFPRRRIEFMDICMEYIVHTPFVLTSKLVLLDLVLETLLAFALLRASTAIVLSEPATTAMGKQKKLPKATGDKGYPANGDANYAGLCDFSCNYGYCPSQACSLEQKPAYIPTSSPFNSPACVRGSGMGNTGWLM